MSVTKRERAPGRDPNEVLLSIGVSEFVKRQPVFAAALDTEPHLYSAWKYWLGFLPEGGGELSRSTNDEIIIAGIRNMSGTFAELEMLDRKMNSLRTENRPVASIRVG